MVGQHPERALKVVAAFKTLLDASTREKITDAQYEELTIIVHQAISDELHAAADLVEETARQLRQSAAISEVGL
jgi:hypothetical protein